MRHSLFFLNFEEADEGEIYVRVLVGDRVNDIYQSNDGETGSIEVRFFTDTKLDRYERSMVVRATQPSSYALNCEDYG